jgi:hypothetical protein
MIKFVSGLLSLMILWDFSLHIQELLGYGTYLWFPTRWGYTLFWTCFWGIGSLLSLIIWFYVQKREKEVKNGIN